MSLATSLPQRLRATTRRHSYSFFSSLGRLLENRVGTLMTVSVLGIAMFLPLGLHITLINLERADLQEEQWGALTVFMSPSSGEGEANALAQRLRADARIEAVSLVSPQQGLEEFRMASGLGHSLDLLSSNPLPWVLSVTPSVAQTDALEDAAQSVAAWLSESDDVASVEFDHKWLQRLSALLGLGRAAVTVLILLFGVSVVVVVANTIRLDVAARTDEIEILALVGANNGFIRQPFLYSGFWYGILGGVVAMILTNGVLLYMDVPLQRLLQSYGEQQQLIGLGVVQSMWLLLTAGMLGLVGAWAAVQRHLTTLKVGGTLGRR